MRASLISCLVLMCVCAAEGFAKKEAMDPIAATLSLGKVDEVEISAEFRKVSDGSLLYAWNADKVLRPASTTKLVLTAALLSRLGPNFQMQTKLYHTGKRKGGVVEGDLVLVGDGDPFLVSEELFLIASELRSLGFDTFTGDLIIDNTLFVEEWASEGQNKGSNCALRAYDAPVTALGINFNAISFVFLPASNNKYAEAYVEPFPLEGLQLNNQVSTSEQDAQDTQIRCEQISKEEWKWTARGSIRPSQGPQRVYRAFAHSAWLANSYVRSFFKQFGIRIVGKLREAAKPTNSQLILTHKSKPLSDQVKSINLYSSNYMADMALKRMIVEEGRKGTFAEGAQSLSAFLKQLGVRQPFVLKDASGLSHHTRLSAAQLNTVLLHAANDFRIYPDFLASLPTSGETGSLKNRFACKAGNALCGKIRAKTGTLSEPVMVSALAGYLDHPQYGLVAFTLLQNGKESQQQPSLQDLRKGQESALEVFATQTKGNKSYGLSITPP